MRRPVGRCHKTEGQAVFSLLEVGRIVFNLHPPGIFMFRYYIRAMQTS
jgi:hypothetical protein